MLEREHDSLARALDTLAGRQEWGVKVLADEGRLTEEARSGSAEAAALEDELDARSGGGAYMLRRRLERHVRDAADALASELAEQVHARWPRTAIIMSTAHQDPHTVQTSRKVGAVAYITKPFVAYVVQDALERVSAQRNARPR